MLRAALFIFLGTQFVAAEDGSHLCRHDDGAADPVNFSPELSTSHTLSKWSRLQGIASSLEVTQRENETAKGLVETEKPKKSLPKWLKWPKGLVKTEAEEVTLEEGPHMQRVEKELRYLKQGDLVWVAGQDFDPKTAGKVKWIICSDTKTEVLRFIVDPGEFPPRTVGITEWHPVEPVPYSDEWVFPKEFKGTAEMPQFGKPYTTWQICNVMLEQDGDRQYQRITVEGVTAITLGHGNTLGSPDVTYHPFFGDRSQLESEFLRAPYQMKWGSTSSVGKGDKAKLWIDSVKREGKAYQTATGETKHLISGFVFAEEKSAKASPSAVSEADVKKVWTKFIEAADKGKFSGRTAMMDDAMGRSGGTLEHTLTGMVSAEGDVPKQTAFVEHLQSKCPELFAQILDEKFRQDRAPVHGTGSGQSATKYHFAFDDGKDQDFYVYLWQTGGEANTLLCGLGEGRKVPDGGCFSADAKIALWEEAK